MSTVAALSAGSMAQASEAATADTPAATAPGEAEVGEVIVTAQRRAERLQDVPVSVSVVSGETLAQQGVASLGDVAARMPNLTIAKTGPADQLHIRGTGSGLNGGFEQSVATFVDDVYRSRARSVSVALFDIEQVEVLKGPQTTFFGANAIAGALNIRTIRPGQTRKGNATALYSPSDGEYVLEAGMTAPLSDTLSARVAGRFSGMDGYIDNPRGGDGPNTNDKQGRISLAWDPTDKVSVFARYDIARLRGKGTYNGEILNCPPVGLPAAGICAQALAAFGQIDNKLDYHATGALSGRFHLDMDEVMVNGRIRLEGFDLISTTAYIDQYTRAASDTAEFPGTSVNGTQTFVPVNPGEFYKQFSQEVRLESTFEGPLSLMGGLYYEHNNLTNDVLSGLFFANFSPLVSAFYPPQTAFGIHWYTKQRGETWSGFGSASYKLTDQLTATVGMRYSSVHKVAHRVVTFGSGGRFFFTPDNFIPVPAAAQPILGAALGQSQLDFADPARTDDKFMPSANLTYKITNDATVYVSYSSGFKAGGFGYVSRDTFDAENVDAYEFGLKASWLDRRMFTDIAVFRSDYKNLQEAQNFTTSAGVPVLSIGNAARSRAQGVEFSGAFQVNDLLRLTSDLAYLDSKYTSYPNAPCTPYLSFGKTSCSQDLSGKRRPFAPKWSGNVAAAFEAPIGDDLLLTIGGMVYFKTAYFHEAAQGPFLREPPHEFLDARVGVGARDRSWDVSVIGKNLTDEVSAERRTFTSGANGTITAVAARPRSIAVQARLNF